VPLTSKTDYVDRVAHHCSTLHKHLAKKREIGFVALVNPGFNRTDSDDIACAWQTLEDAGAEVHPADSFELMNSIKDDLTSHGYIH
jgi:hypothetical protein